jgi:hypothetical protein
MSHQSSKAKAFVTTFTPSTVPETVDIRDPIDSTPSDSQPPGVDEEPQSLEEALLG